MSAYLNISTSPHTRSPLTTGRVMRDVLISLMPVSLMGVWHFGVRALLVLITSVGTAVLTEFVFDKIARRGDTWKDGSAAVTGLLLGLCLSPAVPPYIPVLGAMFAILFVKCFFGGLGRNFMNPALAGRCFLLISFSGTMTNYAVSDAVSSATPLVGLLENGQANLKEMFLGTGSASGVIGCSILALLIGGIYLFAVHAITWEIPVSALVTFGLFIMFFGGRGLDPMYILAHYCGGGIVMGALFMATDPVTSPVTKPGQLIYGASVGILAGLFRVFASSADSVSYAIIIANLLTPLIDEYVVPLPFGLKRDAAVGNAGSPALTPKMLLPALRLTVITLLAGLGLAGVFHMTKASIESQKLAKKNASYMEVLPEAAEFVDDDALTSAIDCLEGQVYGTAFGKAYINEAVRGVDASGNTVGYVVNASSKDGFDGEISLSVGVNAEGAVEGISFTQLTETAGMGMRVQEPEFKDQFAGRNVSRFVLNKAGGSTSDDEIDSVSGASISSGAVVNAVNAALDFLAASKN